ncbi:bifunctional [glutamine synthetase] adenylyltransferase/[glutamine synthetase]-adenylyl-L-tyrosine phosphorylase [Arcanobacterium bovis]|uniref:Bifunctional [glutamine synthetase] adenylyltransferase/[glutamine synthetase]-adenylyl-L-tyrosine phosphorylase n=1 Tax=Arcanobacterium bovis TaxID=2529275 RepID=A0A4Q9V149_9ACTO|nr:bifunctional [glutamine synthetase] adenylyltransferase/[glutamine synthetase]-adenylyl-L-tyrosine phosphorylase [Arcanobacterium bovis]TBW22814.1 bifunctional [glutamine synthetase] adenylyltransferase/[glutamine synthetase]-adenylyl-L-tyrosine phosphorylase [Arcanobacterium bovis]
MNRIESQHAQLIRAGFMDTDKAQRLLADPNLSDVDQSWLIKHAGDSADPDLALLAYLRLLESARIHGKAAMDALYVTCEEETACRRLFAILGMSSALGDYLIAHPANVHILQDYKIGSYPLETTLVSEQEAAVAAVHGVVNNNGDAVSTLSCDDAIAAVRAHYWYRMIQLAAVDLTEPHAGETMPQVARCVSDVIGGVFQAGLAVARAHISRAQDVGFTVIAMGKTGAREVNYISDVDVIYVARAIDPELDDASMLNIATQIANFLQKLVSMPASEPALWEIDPNLRPEGKDGPLVRTLDSHIAYYKRWAQDWEFQALLKARPIAGDCELGANYICALQPMVWQASERPNFVEDSRAMRRRVEDLVPKKDADNELKLGRGGLRDVEFTVQLLQLVHGRLDENLRVRPTLDGLRALSEGGYVSRNSAQELSQSYKFLRALEHRIQLYRFRRSHLVPNSEQELRRIARALQGYDLATAEDLKHYFHKVQRRVRELHLEIYYRPLLPEVAKLSTEDISLNSQAAQARLAAIGYRDPVGALNHIRALTSGISRTVMIQRQLLPVMIGWFAEGAEPDQGLRSFRIISEQMGSTSWYMRTLRDSALCAERLARLLASSRYITQALPSLPESITWLDGESQLVARSFSELERELESLLSRREGSQEIALAGRYLRRKELLRIAMAQVLGLADGSTTQRAISYAADIAIEAALRAARAKTSDELGEVPIHFAVIAMGRFGGQELSYASDADVIFIHEALPGVEQETADVFANSLARNLIALLNFTAQEPVLPVDADLRPEGKNGPLSRSISSCRAYYDRWVDTWEKQALLRARYCVGSHELAQKFFAMIDPLRYPEDGLDAAQLREIRMLKARMERERMPRGVDPTRQVKLGRGGLSDVEWCAQLLQLNHAHQFPQLRSTDTISVLKEAASQQLLDHDDARKLICAWELASQLRDLNVLGTGRTQGAKIDVVPHESTELGIIAALLGYPLDKRHDVAEDYLRAARQARKVCERVFYGED